MLNLRSLMYLTRHANEGGCWRVLPGAAAVGRGGAHDGHAGDFADAALEVLQSKGKRIKREGVRHARGCGITQPPPQKSKEDDDGHLVAGCHYEAAMLRAAVDQAIVRVPTHTQLSSSVTVQARGAARSLVLAWQPLEARVACDA